MTPFDEIKALLEEIEHELIEHEIIRDSDHAVEVTGWPLEQGAKAMLFKIDGEFTMIVLRASDRTDMKKIQSHFDTKKVRFAKPDEVEEVMGVKIGACYPLPISPIAEIPMYLDSRLDDNEHIAFSPGSHNHHIRLKKDHFFEIVDPVLIDVSI